MKSFKEFQSPMLQMKNSLYQKIDDSSAFQELQKEIVQASEAVSEVTKAISLFGSARVKDDNPSYLQAQELAKSLALSGISIITGGGPGIMEAANKGAIEANKILIKNSKQTIHSVGFNVRLPKEQKANLFQTISLEFQYFFARKLMFARSSSAFIYMPGGMGTLDEVFDILTLQQTGKIPLLPMIFIGTQYWKGLFDWLQSSTLHNNFIEQNDLDRLLITDDLEHAVKAIQQSVAI